MVEKTPMSTVLSASPSTSRASRAVSRRVSSIRARWVRMLRPSSVISTPRPSRRNSDPPSSSSSLRIATVSAGCDTALASAALVKLRWSQTARKYRIW